MGLGAQGDFNTLAAIESQNLKPDIYDLYLTGVAGSDWTTWNSPAGEYVLAVAADAQSVGAIPMFVLYQMSPSDVSLNGGHLAFMVFYGKFDGRLFVEFTQRLLRQAAGNVYLIVDGHPVHRSIVAKRFVEANNEQLRLIRLPGYCPELNPDELLNQDVKTNALGKSRPANRAEMMAGVRSHLHRRQRQPQIILNLFQEKHVRYAA